MTMKNIGLIGLGAIGAPLSIALHQYDPDHFFVIAQGARKERLRQGVMINDQCYHFPILEPQQHQPLDLIIITTKYNQLSSAIDDIRNFVDDHTRIIPFLNGISAEEKLADVFGMKKIIYGFVKIAAMNVNHHIQYKDPGCYYFGHPDNKTWDDDIQALHDLFSKAHIRHTIPDDMLSQKWFKYMCNVSENQVSAILDIPFGAWNASDHANALRKAVGHETYLIAKAKGIDIPKQWIDDQREALNQLPYHNCCSMVQDMRAKRHSEVDMFAGDMIKMGKEYNIPTPYNEMLYHMIKVLEEKNDGKI